MGEKIGSGHLCRPCLIMESLVRSGHLGTAPLPAATLNGVRTLLPRPITPVDGPVLYIVQERTCLAAARMASGKRGVARKPRL